MDNLYYSSACSNPGAFRYSPGKLKIAKDIGSPNNFFLPRFIELCCFSNYFPSVEIIQGLPEGKGVQAKTGIPKFSFVCNYGGKLLTKQEGKSYMDRKQDYVYLYEFSYDQCGKHVKAYYNHDSQTCSVGKYINHSRIHTNVTPKVLFQSDGTPEIMFISTCKIEAGEQILFDYGPSYPDVKDCVSSCKKCSFLFTKN